MKKQWISVKCGLSRDPKHRQAMGEGIWLFLHILDIATWDDGIAHDWKDEAAAEDMGMPVRTLREHRRKLADLGYITCNQKQYTQDIVIHNWTNPREYGGQIYNPTKQGDIKQEPEGYTQGNTQGNRKDVTPTYNSNNKESKNDDVVLAEISKAYQSSIGLIDAPISDELKEASTSYPLQWTLDAIHEAAIQNKRSWKYILAILTRWKAQGNQEAMKPQGFKKTAPVQEPAAFEAIRQFERMQHGD